MRQRNPLGVLGELIRVGDDDDAAGIDERSSCTRKRKRPGGPPGTVPTEGPDPGRVCSQVPPTSALN